MANHYRRKMPLTVTNDQIATAKYIIGQSRIRVTHQAKAEHDKLERGPVEIGPIIGDTPLSKEECLRALRRFRREKISFSEIARQCGYRPETLLNAFHMERMGPKLRSRITWVIRALIRRELVVVRGRGKGQVFLPTGKGLDNPNVRARIEQCICGRYKICPCGAVKSRWVQQSCLRSRSVAQARNVKEITSTRPRLPNPDVLDVDPSPGSGFQSLSEYAKSLHK